MKRLSTPLANYLPVLTVCVFSALFILSCEKEKSAEIKDLEFLQETYYISEGENFNIRVSDGNKKYSLGGFDDELIAPMVSITDFPAGAIYVNALKKGTTVITIKDDVSGQEAELTIHVVDPFLAMKVGDIMPVIKDGEFETGQAIRDKVRSEPQHFSDFEAQGVLVLQQNADNRFWLFKNEEDAARGEIHASGKFTLEFSFAGPNRLLLEYDDSDQIAEYGLYTVDHIVFGTLVRWPQISKTENRAANIHSDISKSLSMRSVTAEVRQNTSPVEGYSSQLFLIKDFTSFFKETYPEVERVELFQNMTIYGNRSGYLTLADGILN